MAFGITSDGYLRVTASAKGRSEISTIHLNVDVFAVIVESAGLTALQTVRILEVVLEALKQPGVEVCCETVELSDNQVQRLCLRPDRQRSG
jgi:hypothetical protein